MALSEKKRASNKRYLESHREESRAYAREYYRTHKEQHIKKTSECYRKRYERDPEAMRAYWREQNRKRTVRAALRDAYMTETGEKNGKD